MPKERHSRLGRAKPSVFTRLGTPGRLLTSRQGRTGGGAGSPRDAHELRNEVVKGSSRAKK